MKYYINLFSPQTHGGFSKSDQTISGFSIKQKKAAEKIEPGDRYICYITKISRFCGLFEVIEGPFIDDTPIFLEQNDPFTLRFKVKALVWLEFDHSIPMFDPKIWDKLSRSGTTRTWTGIIRGSLQQINPEDGKFLEESLLSQTSSPVQYALSEKDLKKIKGFRVRTQKKAVVEVTVPDREENGEEVQTTEITTPRDSIRIQAMIAEIGERMNMQIWIPRPDRSRVLELWEPKGDSLLESLPLNYDDVTLSTIENIDALWIRRRTIIRAFEVEHTTSIYSGILRMADLMALQPNLDIKAHIVAPEERKEKVFQEITRPVFSLLEKGPLVENCTYLSYESVEKLRSEKLLEHMHDDVLDEFAEEATVD